MWLVVLTGSILETLEVSGLPLQSKAATPSPTFWSGNKEFENDKALISGLTLNSPFQQMRMANMSCFSNEVSSSRSKTITHSDIIARAHYPPSYLVLIRVHTLRRAQLYFFVCFFSPFKNWLLLYHVLHYGLNVRVIFHPSCSSWTVQGGKKNLNFAGNIDENIFNQSSASQSLKAKARRQANLCNTCWTV